MVQTSNGAGREGRRDTRPEAQLRRLLHPLRQGRAMARRGIRTVILALLAREPMHGYQVMQELEARSGGRWRPSPGSVYPTLQQLEDEGLVQGEEAGGRRVYAITDDGKKALAQSPLGRLRSFAAEGNWEKLNLRKEAMGLVGAAIQVSRVGSPETQAKAREILVQSRRELYRLLADEEEIPETGPEAGGQS